MNERIRAWTDRLNRVVLAAAVVLLVLAVLVIIANVATRYIGRASLPWSSELARYLVVWSALLASAVLTARDEHLLVDALGDRIGELADRRVRAFVRLVSTTFYLILFVSGVLLVIHTTGQVTSSVRWLPIALVYGVVPLAALLMVLGTLGDVFAENPGGEEARS